MNTALEGVRVIEWAMFQQGPVAASLLGDLSAEVIKIDPRFETIASRGQHGEELCAILADRFSQKTLAEWLKIYQSLDLMGAPVKTISDLIDDPQVLANNYIIEYDHPALSKTKMMGFPIDMSVTPPAVQREAPELGQHSETIMAEILGYSWADINKLKDEEVI